jgi:hypothetical protein
MECQRLFLSLYFRENVEVTQAVIIDLKRNGIIVYVPKYDMQGKVFLSDKNGNVQVDPTLLGLPSTSGLPPSSGFAPLEGCRMFPDGRCSLIDERNEAESRLEVYLPNATSTLTFRRLDVITVQLSCDLSDVVARVPPPRLHLLSMEKSHKVKTYHKEILTVSTNDSDNNQATHYGEVGMVVEEKPQSMFNVLCSIPIVPNLDNIPLRYNTPKKGKKHTNRVQTIKGRIFMNGFRAEQLEADKLDNDVSLPSDHQSLTNQALVGDSNASRRIEREATARMQRIAAEKRNSKRSKAMKRH